MGKYKKLFELILTGRSDSNIRFSELCRLLGHLDFEEKVKGSHHIFHRYEVEEILNLQPIGDKAKRYQVKQVRDIIVKYELVFGRRDEED